MEKGNIATLQEMDPAQIFSLTGDTKVQEIIGKLKFIAKIKHGEKINVRELFVRDNDSVAQRVFRTVRNYGSYLSSSEIVESKTATLLFIQQTVNEAITLISVYRNGDEFKQNIANLIVENLELSKAGIRNSIATYQCDRKFISEAEAVIQTLEVRINSLKKKGLMNGMSDTSFMPPVTPVTTDITGDLAQPSQLLDIPNTTNITNTTNTGDPAKPSDTTNTGPLIFGNEYEENDNYSGYDSDE